MTRYNIKTAHYFSFSDYQEARRHIDEVQYDIVIKATGLVGLFGVLFLDSRPRSELRGLSKEQNPIDNNLQLF